MSMVYFYREVKCSGINMVRRLTMYHPDVVLAQLHSVVIAMLNEVSDLSIVLTPTIL